MNFSVDFVIINWSNLVGMAAGELVHSLGLTASYHVDYCFRVLFVREYDWVTGAASF